MRDNRFLPERRKRAIRLGIMIWIAVFVIGIATVYLLGPESQNSSATSLLGVVSLLFLTFISSVHYFQTDVHPSTYEGLKLGATFFVIGTILDLAVAFPLIFSNTKSGTIAQLVNYYISPLFLIASFVVFAVPSLVGYFLKRRKSHR